MISSLHVVTFSSDALKTYAYFRGQSFSVLFRGIEYSIKQLLGNLGQILVRDTLNWF